MPSSTADTHAALRFGCFELRPLERRLLIDGRPATLGSRAFELLLAIAERRGALVTKRELLDLVWPDTVVEEGNLTVQMSSLRKLLGPDAIATVPGRGYRFTAPLGEHAAPAVADTGPSAPLLPLLGRDAELAGLGALLDTHRLVTIAGAGGIGKTRLAQHLLDAKRLSHPHGACWVGLATLAAPAQVAGAIAAALGIHGSSHGEPLAQLVAACAPLQLLLALDNAEHLHDEVARVAQALLDGAPGVRLLVTSQLPLKLAEERLYRLDGLAVPDRGTPADAARSYGAVALFVARAAALDRRFALHGDNVATVIEICRRLDGIALAIELAAARMPLLGLARLAAALDERLAVLTAAPRGVPPRHQTLRAGLEWSHALLSAAEQAAFRRLAVLHGSGSLDLVQALLDDGTTDRWTVLETLGALVDRSLVAAEGEPTRYRLLESPRALALERLSAAGEDGALRARHGRSVAALMQRALDDLRTRDGAVEAWQRALEPDFDNARAAFAWGCAHDATAAAAVAATLLLALPGLRERLAICEAVEPLLGDAVAASLRARVWLEGAGALRLRRSRAAMSWVRQALAHYEHSGEPAGLLLALAEYVQCARRERTLGDAEAEALLTRLQDLEQQHELPPQIAARGVRAATLLLRHLGRPADEAVRNQQRAIALEMAAGEPYRMASVNYTNLLIELGRADDALAFGLPLLGRLQGTRQVWGLDLLQANLTAAWLALSRAPEARALARAAWSQRALVESQPSWADHLAWLAGLEGRPRDAARLVGHADALYALRRHTRQGVELQSHAQALALAGAALEQVEVARLRAEGAALDDDAAKRVAFADQEEVRGGPRRA